MKQEHPATSPLQPPLAYRLVGDAATPGAAGPPGRRPHVGAVTGPAAVLRPVCPANVLSVRAVCRPHDVRAMTFYTDHNIV
jgi:hypothetical protein